MIIDSPIFKGNKVLESSDPFTPKDIDTSSDKERFPEISADIDINAQSMVVRESLDAPDLGSASGATWPYVEYTVNESYEITGAKLYCENAIPTNIFSNYSQMTTLDISNCKNLTTIGASAFASCTKLELNALPDGITVIKDKAFSYCYALSLTELPNTITTINEQAFYYCTHLNLTKLPNSLTTISSQGFRLCINMPLTELPNNIISIGPYAFQDCNKLAITKLPANLTTLNRSVFAGCTSLTLTEIPANITTIIEYAFSNCTGLTSLTFKGTPQTIQSKAFDGCTNLLDIYVPWAEGAVAGAPWGAPNATIHYDSVV